MQKKFWTKKEYDQLVKFFKKGYLAKDIAKFICRSESSVRSKLRENGHLFMKNVYLSSQKDKEKVDNVQIESIRLLKEIKRYKKLYEKATDALISQTDLATAFRDKIVALPKINSRIKDIKTVNKISEETLVLFLSDIHYGEVISSEEMLDLNEYNCEIANKRLWVLADTVKKIAVTKLIGYKFNKLVIFVLGDIVSGTIHEELLEGNSGNIVDWVTGSSFVLAQLIRDLSASFATVEVVCVVGNHGRLKKKPYFKKRYVGWDYLCYQMVKMLLNDQKNVTIDTPKSFWALKKIEGYTFLLMHGDDINSWQGIPFYGIKRAIAKLSEVLHSNNRSFEYVALAHFHNLGYLDGAKGGILMNGSVKGMDEFGIGKLFVGSQACQYLIGVHKDHGVTFSYRIDLQKAAKKDLNGYISPGFELNYLTKKDEIKK